MSTDKRLLFVIGTMGNGGAERVIAALANYYSERGIRIQILTIYGDAKDYELLPAIEYYPIRCKRSRLLRPIERIKNIREHIKSFRPNCVISFLTDVNIHTIIASIGLDTPLIVSERNDPANDPQQRYQRVIRDFIYRKVNGIVFQTPDAAAYFKNKLSKRVLVKIIPNPLTPNLPKHVFKSDSTRLITACRLNPQKNLPLMIESVKELVDEGYECTLDIFGQGPLYNNLQQLLVNLNATSYIQLKGFSRSIHDEMSDSLAFVISSDYEGISNSMLEALAIGVPVIATDCPVGGARMFITNRENGLLVPVRNKKALKEAMKLVLDSKEKAEMMGTAAMKIRKELSIDLIAKKWMKFINLVIDSKWDVCC